MSDQPNPTQDENATPRQTVTPEVGPTEGLGQAVRTDDPSGVAVGTDPGTQTQQPMSPADGDRPADQSTADDAQPARQDADAAPATGDPGPAT